MAVNLGINFRATAIYVTDAAGQTYSIADAYPQTRGGSTFGWTTAVDSRDRTTGQDVRLAGNCQQANSGTQAIFRFNCPAGEYKIRLALGDAGGSQAKQYLQIRDSDSSTALLTIDDTSGTGNNAFDDATGVERSAAAWPGSNAEATITTTGAMFFVYIGTPTAQTESSSIAHLHVEDAVAGPTSGFTAAVDLKTVTLTNTSTAGSNPITSTTVNWGDGTTNSLLTHTYAVGGEYTITLTSSDGTLTDDEVQDVATETRYKYTVQTVGGRNATVDADRPDA